jgi:hypothetical protein
MTPDIPLLSLMHSTNMHRIFKKYSLLFLKISTIPAKSKKTVLIYTIKAQQIECLQQPTKTKTNIVGPAQKSSGVWGVTAATSSVTATSPRAQRQAHQH